MKEIKEITEAQNLGTVTVTKKGSKLTGKIGRAFYKFSDGRVNAQFQRGTGNKGDLWNITLKPGEFVFNEEYLVNLDAAILEATK